VAPPGNQAVNGENKHQPDVSEETGLLDYIYIIIIIIIIILIMSIMEFPL